MYIHLLIGFATPTPFGSPVKAINKYSAKEARYSSMSHLLDCSVHLNGVSFSSATFSIILSKCTFSWDWTNLLTDPTQMRQLETCKLLPLIHSCIWITTQTSNLTSSTFLVNHSFHKLKSLARSPGERVQTLNTFVFKLLTIRALSMCNWMDPSLMSNFTCQTSRSIYLDQSWQLFTLHMILRFMIHCQLSNPCAVRSWNLRCSSWMNE